MTFKQAQLCSEKNNIIKIYESKGWMECFRSSVTRLSGSPDLCPSGANRDMYFGWKPLRVFWSKAPNLTWAWRALGAWCLLSSVWCLVRGVNKCVIKIWYVVLSKAVYFSVQSLMVWYANMRQMPRAHSELYPISIAWYVFEFGAFFNSDKGNPKANGLLHKCQLCFSQISWETMLPLIMHGCLWCPQ